MIYIYANSDSNRLQYTLEVLFQTILQVPFKVVDMVTFQALKNVPKINYSDKELQATIWIKPHSLLFEDGIQTQDIQVTHHKDIPCFFKTDELIDFKYDIFASSFYLLSRYEEYLPFTPDNYGRFSAKKSLAYKANFLQKPVVHLWANLLRDTIVRTFPDYVSPKRKYKNLTTIDIDIAYSCKGKPWFRRLGAFAKGLFHFYNKAVWESVYCNFSKKDSYDTYDLLKELQKENTLESIYFFQIGAYGKYDKNLPLNTTMQSLIKRIATYAKVGLHPSYQSNLNNEILKREYQNLTEVVGESIEKSRQHYLKLQFPTTYENLISVGIKEDYTLGFADAIGFRAGMALPFPFYNLQTEEKRPLILVPFQVMDGTLKDYLQLTPEKAITVIQQLKETVKQVDGLLVSIFHNSSVTDNGEWLGWLEVYREVIR